jgi:hypothetical protein
MDLTPVVQLARERGAARSLPRWIMALLIAALATFQCRGVAEAAQVPVRFAEGTVHGFLVVRNASDSIIGYGDLLQIPRSGAIESRMTFRFNDGSRFQESVTFSQKGTFRMRSYALEMSGPGFPYDQKISLTRSSADESGTGKYRVETKSKKDGKVDLHEGSIKLPDDVYNGMVITIAKNLTKQAHTRVHFVVFMPKPRLIELDLNVANSQKVMLGGFTRNSVHFVIKPQLGGLLQILAKLFHKLPPDNHVWILTNDVPAFVRSDGALYTKGPQWRVELAVPRLPR